MCKVKWSLLEFLSQLEGSLMQFSFLKLGHVVKLFDSDNVLYWVYLVVQEVQLAKDA